MKNIEFRKLLISFVVISFLVSKTTAQKLETLPGQVSFVYPLGTSGTKSGDHEYGFSLNILTGYTGGVNGCELGGLVNTTKNGVNGFQAAGVANFVQSNINGAQLSGVINTSASVTGFQASGVINITKGKIEGIQMAGTANIANESFRGAQFGGAINTAKNFVGFQAAGNVNIINDSLRGCQAAGLVNISKQVNGLQLSGIMNIANGNLHGVQISCINSCGKLNGSQIGLINIVDTAESGVAVGLVNIYRSGMYHEFEISTSDRSNIALSYKMGLRKFYTIYTVGASIIEDKLWFFGAGFGHISQISSKWSFQPEAVFQTFMPSDLTNINWTSSNRLKLGFVYSMSESIGISISPEFYVNTSDKEAYKISPIKPLYSSSSKRTELGVGLSLGISFNR